MLLTALQIPFYLYAMSRAVYRMCDMLVSTMRAERNSDYQAHHDVLTGLPNRPFIIETVATSAGLPTALTLVDIDRFKTVNDTYGHQVGNVVLQTVGTMMLSHLSSFGTVGLYGGEEFALIAPEASSHQLMQVSRGLLADVESAPIPVDGRSIRVTLSAGIAYRGPGEDFEQVYSDADMALYLAKRSGRNRLEVAASARKADAYDSQDINDLPQASGRRDAAVSSK